MFINNDRRFIFVHVPKTGGISVTKQLSVDFASDDCSWELYNDSQHLSAFALREKYPDYFIFSFIRNPYDRMISFYHFKDRQVVRAVRKTKLKNRVIFPPFKIFVKNLVENGKMANLMTNSQKSFLCSKSGYMICDWVGRFESLRDDYRHVLARFDDGVHDLIIHKNKSVDRKGLESYYDDETRERVFRFWKEDFDEFGYF